jgi:hypothetical protein
MIRFTLFIILDEVISYESDGKKKRRKHISEIFKVINSNNLLSHWVGHADTKEYKDLDKKVDFAAFLDASPKLSVNLYLGSRFYQALFYLFNEDFRTIDEEMINVAEKIFKDFDQEFGVVRDFLCKYKGKKIFSCVESPE